jgi:murein DD-endopeptidase MepM/ murein hydrolase activator NlpD
MRFHPILKQWRAHNGVDYGAPTGTRVRATADGTVDFAGVQGGYGKVVVLRHHGGITTAYAHLSGIAGDVRRGARVAQGDTIGFVGATGWATGPHLHYEFRVNNQHRNPLTIAMPAAEPVPADRMGAFNAIARPRAAQLELLADVRLAALE